MIEKNQIEQVLVGLNKDLANLRTGRAMPSLLENLPVEAYGGTLPLQQLASITAPEPRLLVIQTWDQQTIKEVEKAIRQSDLGLNPAVDGALIRVPFPALTEDKRKELVKVMHAKLEEARIKLRQVREGQLKDFKVQKTNGALSEDDYFRLEKELQILVDEANQRIQTTGDTKEKEMMTI